MNRGQHAGRRFLGCETYPGCGHRESAQRMTFPFAETSPRYNGHGELNANTQPAPESGRRVPKNKTVAFVWCRGEDLNLHGVSPTST